MAAIVYLLGAAITLCCAVLLLRGYAVSKRKLLLWSGLCFAGLTLSNVLLFVDLEVVPSVDLFHWRLLTAIAAMSVLLYGLIWENK